MADSLPGLGIVAAVLGVVITMSALGGPPEEIGHKVAAALVGTFLGILLCYGFLGPVAANLKKQSDAESEYLSSLRMGLLAYMKGMSRCSPWKPAGARSLRMCGRPSSRWMKPAGSRPRPRPPRWRRERQAGIADDHYRQEEARGHDDEHGGAWKVPMPIS